MKIDLKDQLAFEESAHAARLRPLSVDVPAHSQWREEGIERACVHAFRRTPLAVLSVIRHATPPTVEHAPEMLKGALKILNRNKRPFACGIFSIVWGNMNGLAIIVLDKRTTAYLYTGYDPTETYRRWHGVARPEYIDPYLQTVYNIPPYKKMVHPRITPHMATYLHLYAYSLACCGEARAQEELSKLAIR